MEARPVVKFRTQMAKADVGALRRRLASARSLRSLLRYRQLACTVSGELEEPAQPDCELTSVHFMHVTSMLTGRL